MKAKHFLLAIILILVVSQIHAQSASYSHVFNNCLQFSAAQSSYLTGTNHTSIQNTGSMTIEAWINPSSNTEMAIFEKYSGCQHGYILRMNASRQIIAGTMDAVNCSILTSTSSVPLGQWSHIAMTFSASTQVLKIYINGVLSGTLSSARIPSASNNYTFYVGKRGDLFNIFFDGAMDEIRMWGAERSQIEIQASMNAPLIGNEPDLKLYYNMNQTGQGLNIVVTNNSTSSASGGANTNATTSNGTSNTNFPAFTSLRSALDFDGVDDYISIPQNAGFNPTNQLTLEAWVYLNGTNHQAIIHNWAPTNQYTLEIYNNQAGFVINTSTGALHLSSPTNMPVNQWVHLAGVYDGNTMKIYENGILKNTASKTGNFTAISSGDIHIGRRDDGVSGFTFGKIDEVRIWHVARTQVEIQSKMNCEIPTTETGLAVNYHFNQGFNTGVNTAQTTLIDVSGNSRNGILNSFSLNSANSNWVSSGAMSNGALCCIPNANSTAHTECNSYTWNNTIYTTSGTYNGTFTNSAGCDSVHTLNLTILPSPTLCSVSNSTATFCQGSSIPLTYNHCEIATQNGFAGAYQPSNWINNVGFNTSSFNFTAIGDAGGYINLANCPGYPPNSPSTPVNSSISIPISASGLVSFNFSIGAALYTSGICTSVYYAPENNGLSYKINSANPISIYIPPALNGNCCTAGTASINVNAGDTLTIIYTNVYRSAQLTINNFSGPYATQAISWYDQASGGNLLGNGTSISVTPQFSNQLYYAQVQDITTACVNASRIQIQVGVMNNLPVLSPASSSPSTICLGGTTELSNNVSCTTTSGYGGPYKKSNWTFSGNIDTALSSLITFITTLNSSTVSTASIIADCNGSMNFNIIGSTQAYFALPIQQWLPGSAPTFGYKINGSYYPITFNIALVGLQFPIPSTSYTANINITVQKGDTLEFIQSVSSTPNNQTFESFMQLATAPIGYLVSWYDVPTGGTSLGSGQSIIYTPTINGVNIYYAELQDYITGCTNPSRVATNPINVNSCHASVDVSAILQGYHIGNGIMTTALSNQGVGNSNTNVDSVTIELHDSIAPYNLIKSVKAILQSNGIVSCIFNDVVFGKNYYLVLNNKNHIETWSATPVTLASNVSYNFTDLGSKAYGSNQVEVELGIWALYSGDIDQNGYLELDDYNLWDAEYQTGYPYSNYAPDLDGNGYVELDDYNIWDNNYQNGVYSIRP